MTTSLSIYLRPISYCHFCGKRLIRKTVDGYERLFCTACGIPIYQNPVPATCVVVVEEENNLLLVKRSVEPRIGEWCLPGGFVELGEFPDKSALRELKEETGLSGSAIKLLGVSTNPSIQYHSILMIGYLIRRFSGTPVAGDDAAEVGWFPLNDLPEIAFDSHRRFVRQYRNMKHPA
ncbi:MAG: NUDIX hydrolase [Desulfobacterales bacterium]